MEHPEAPALGNSHYGIPESAISARESEQHFRMQICSTQILPPQLESMSPPHPSGILFPPWLNPGFWYCASQPKGPVTLAAETHHRHYLFFLVWSWVDVESGKKIYILCIY